MITVTLSYLQTTETLYALKKSYWETVELHRRHLDMGLGTVGTGGMLTDQANAINILNEARLKERVSV